MSYWSYDGAGVEELMGQVIEKITNVDNYELHFETKDMVYIMYHEQDCCESVYIEDVIGDLDDLIGSPITMAEETSEFGNDDWGTQTWTFYKFASVNGYVTIRWYGSSNGYYSESVSFVKKKREEV